MNNRIRKIMWVLVFLLTLSFCWPTGFLQAGEVRSSQTRAKSKSKDTVTVLIYMNGSNLESDDGSATADLKEMIAAGSSSNVNVLVQTMGTRKWDSTYKIASNRSQIYSVGEKGLTLVKDDLGQLDCTAEKTLKDFIKWGVKEYSADRYMLLFWDHGGGPVYGFGYDEHQDEDASLTMDEIRSAIKSTGVHFECIGFDACLMSSLEVCAALHDVCDYTILSEDFEPGIGWHYTNWLKALYKDSSISMKDLGKIIVDDTIKANQTDKNGDECILAVVDQSKIKLLYGAWIQFAYDNESALLGNNYSRAVKSRGRTLPRGGRPELLDLISDWLFDEDEDYSLNDYYISDIMAIASTIDSDESAALAAALNQAIVYVNSTSGISGETGISVTLPYGDKEFYKSLKVIFKNCGIDEDYIKWLEKFTTASGSSSFQDYDDFDEEWDNWDDYEDDFDWSLWDLFFDDDYWDDDFWGDDDDDWWDYEDDDDDDWWWDDDDDWWWDDDDDDWWDDDDDDWWGDDDDDWWDDDDDDWWDDDDDDWWDDDDDDDWWGDDDDDWWDDEDDEDIWDILFDW